MKFFWQSLPRPFLVQAPMEDVTDTVFRRIIKQSAPPDVFFTEFTNVDGLFSKGAERVGQRLEFTEEEKPLIAQIWGNTPENYLKTGKMLKERGFDGIDINMGCPIHDVASKGYCSGLINNPSLARELILALKEGVDGAIPVSVKTRIGYKTIQTEEWIGFLLEQELDALTVHGRTVEEQSRVPAHWDEIGKAVTLRDSISSKTLIIGNGDIESRKQAEEMYEKYKVDGIMIGRGIFHDIFVFSKEKSMKDISLKERFTILKNHLKLFHTTWNKKKNFDIMRKFYKVYTHGLDNAAELRAALMACKTFEETIHYIDSHLLK